MQLPAHAVPRPPSTAASTPAQVAVSMSIGTTPGSPAGESRCSAACTATRPREILAAGRLVERGWPLAVRNRRHRPRSVMSPRSRLTTAPARSMVEPRQGVSRRPERISTAILAHHLFADVLDGVDFLSICTRPDGATTCRSWLAITAPSPAGNVAGARAAAVFGAIVRVASPGDGARAAR